MLFLKKSGSANNVVKVHESIMDIIWGGELNVYFNELKEPTAIVNELTDNEFSVDQGRIWVGARNNPHRRQMSGLMIVELNARKAPNRVEGEWLVFDLNDYSRVDWTCVPTYYSELASFKKAKELFEFRLSHGLQFQAPGLSFELIEEPNSQATGT